MAPPASTPDSTFRATGFTLIELITIILVMAILAAVAAPRFMQRAAFQERGFQDATRSILRYAQRVAIAERREVCVALTPATVALTLNPLPAAGAACTAIVTAPGESGPYVIAAPPGVALAFPNPVFPFNALGQPIDDATGATLPDQVIALPGSSLPAITVFGQTGYVL